jgi:peptidoglycan/xylan/chitin deacetylase (PgdA/CDA1 family)
MSFRETQRGRHEHPPKRASRSTPGRVTAVGALVLVALLAVVIVLNSTSKPHRTTPGAPRSTTSGHPATSTSRTTAAAGAQSVPILVYHVINTQPAGSSASSALYVPVDEFSGHMQALKAAGWHPVTLNQLEAYWTHGASLGPGKPIVLSFDNGYASHYTNALPVLRGLGWVGVENLPLAGLPPSEGGLGDTQVRGLIAAGWELDTQGISQTDLTAVGQAQLTNETAAARHTLSSRYGVPVNWFSYPNGDYDATVVSAVRAAGYVGATTVNRGWASPTRDRFRLPRLVVAGGTTSTQLLAQIAAAQNATAIPPSYTGSGLA